MEHVAFAPRHPIGQLLHLRRQFLAGHRLEHAPPKLDIRDRVIQDERAHGPQRHKRGTNGLALFAQMLVQIALGMPEGPGQQLVEHVHSLIYTVAVALAQEADQRRPASRERQIAQTVGGTVADVSKKSPLIIPVEPIGAVA